MKTYFVLDTDTNSWSPMHLPLKEIMAMPGVTGSHLLADARTQQTLTVAQALAAGRKPRLKSPTIPLVALPEAAPTRKSTPVPASKPTSRLRPAPEMPARKKSKRAEYKVLGQGDECFGGQLDAPSLELALNTYAQQGWKVLSCVPAGGASAADLFIVMERKIAAAPF